MASFEGWLVGRAAVLAELSRLVESTLAGEGQAAFVVGEAGLGKTAVLEQAAAAAERRGLRVLQGSAQELEQACPFAFISSCLRLEESPPMPGAPGSPRCCVAMPATVCRAPRARRPGRMPRRSRR